MTPAGQIHIHRDPTCHKSWPCANLLCVDPVEVWCGQAPCMGEPGLHQVGRIAQAGHMLHIAEQDYRLTFNSPALAERCARLRAQILDLVNEANTFYTVSRDNS